MLGKFQRYHAAHSWFTQNTEIYRSNRTRALEIMTSKCAESMELDHVGIWFFSQNKESLSEELSYSNHTFSHGKSVKVGAFEQLESKSLLVTSIYSDSNVIGVVTLGQNKDTREWDDFDKNFAMIFADLIARFIENEKRHTYEKELQHRIDYLENDLKKKWEDLNEANLSLNLALDGAQLGKWDWDIVTNKVAMHKSWFSKLGYSFNEIPQTFESF